MAPRNARGRHTCAVRRSRGRSQPLWARTSCASARGRACPYMLCSACEVLIRGCLTRLQVATSAALATSNQPS
jgi:hypothetical protein